MKNRNKIYILKIIIQILVMCSILACEDDINKADPIDIDCNNLRKGLIDIDSEVVEIELSKLLNDLKVNVKQDDRWGHKDNFKTLVNRINNNCKDITAELSCYCCMFSNPPQSAILLYTDSLGVNVKRTINIWTPDNNSLAFARLYAASK